MTIVVKVMLSVATVCVPMFAVCVSLEDPCDRRPAWAPWVGDVSFAALFIDFIAFVLWQIWGAYF
jgi:hypothetical protein